ncbi:dynein intermediate chain 2, ciliary [Octopus bimaculoides]|uniref:Uncharacterized protein n=1 Tax=Octopus bimaculoides TaxID=37653 RepID=A0A0L8HJD9_OCTBM|nr:dynein intermediate chain 2, ciliary [Octopus bimaculoides]XP_014772141.1 dynein intermediate chain 2, ciliary [Octopus bimaculoides]|eukprot:XP_014772140.1 PREDICTED: dynein intermediate chain 2, ciliary-like [Octopus bimaculoides]
MATRRKSISKKDKKDKTLTEQPELEAVRPDMLTHRKSTRMEMKTSESKMKEEFSLVLTPTVKPEYDNLVRFDFKTSQYAEVPFLDQVIILTLLQGSLIHKDMVEGPKIKTDVPVLPLLEEVEQEMFTEHIFYKKLVNAFNYGDRGSQTYNYRAREQGTLTDPPPKSTFSANVNQWEIYDSYIRDSKKHETERKKPPVSSSFLDSKTAIMMMERMVNQNIFDEITNDYRYYEDESDEFHVSYGTMLPLWKFSYHKTLGFSVTSLCWNNRYSDFFAASFGSYNVFQQRFGGWLLLYSLKNPSYPMYIFQTNSSVMALDFHPEFAYYICVGLYNGHVAVYNLCKSHDALVQKSSSFTGKHHYEVTEVKWQPKTEDVDLIFCSVSTDGRILQWSLVKEELVQLELLKLEIDPLPFWDSNISILSFGCGSSFNFHRKFDHLYLLATQTGKVHVCSKRYCNEVLYTLDAHSMGVNKVEWNHFHPNTFITCSDDWSVKVWEYNEEYKIPLFTFDLGSRVTDVAWAPYSASVFAAATSKGRVLVYDLNLNRYEPMCEQVVVKKKDTEVTRIAFNPQNFSIIAGDSRGDVTGLKLSSNLRKMPKLRKGDPPLEGPAKEAAETAKLDRIFSMAR